MSMVDKVFDLVLGKPLEEKETKANFRDEDILYITALDLRVLPVSALLLFFEGRWGRGLGEQREPVEEGTFICKAILNKSLDLY